MRILELRLLNFRSYPEAAVRLLPGANLLVGPNGAGKTSLLEGLSTLALTRAPRGGVTTDLVAWGSQEMGVSATVQAGGEEGREMVLELRWRFQPPSRRWVRTLRVDGNPQPVARYLGRLRVVSFWPEDLLIVKAGPEPRRRMLDVVLCQLFPAYAISLSRLRRALEQRNSVLRAVRDGAAKDQELEPWTGPLVEAAAAIMEAREGYLEEATPLAAAAALRIGEPTPLSLVYKPGIDDPEGGSWAERMTRALDRSRAEEVARAQTVVGPHRDDFEICLGGRAARQFASQGQQRTAVLALKAAEVAQHLSHGGEAPVLLLDDVLSELDLSHRAGLVQELAGGMGVEQSLVTATEDHGLGEVVRLSQVLEVRRGRVAPRGGG